VADRLTLELDGRRYQRQGGTWADTATYLRASITLSHQLDSLANPKSAFWVQCRAQDFCDDPRKPGLHGDVDTFVHIPAGQARPNMVGFCP
jgi:hypothetical protein